ncbi:MAG: SGNH/GDSL hydrolase family protein [Verrucomicrobiales bacterium]|nr:SGNH/GDSL hydrolase family protein [Verrucomicrobiales bacterium]
MRWIFPLTLLAWMPVSAQEATVFQDSDQPPAGAAPYEVTPDPEAGAHLPNLLHKLRTGFHPDRPLRVWALGSSYTNMLGSGEVWQEEIPQRFPKVSQVNYTKMVGNSCPWQYLRGWAQTLLVADPPDLVLTYTNGEPDDLDKLLTQIRSTTTADIIVPSLHWRQRDAEEHWDKDENAADQDVAAVRAVCKKHGVEFVENRRDWERYLRAQKLPIEALLKDPVHQNAYGASIVNRNILAHLPTEGSSALDDREVRLDAAALAKLEHSGFKLQDGRLRAAQAGATLRVPFTGNCIELIGRFLKDGGSVKVTLDGRPGSEFAAFLPSYIQGDEKNARSQKGDNPRDLAPHGVTLSQDCIPQQWTVLMTNDMGDYTLTGSITGPDGTGNAFKDYTSLTGQITLPADLWRRAERNKQGDRFTFSVTRATEDSVSFSPPSDAEADAEAPIFRTRLANALSNGPHVLTLTTTSAAPVEIEALDVFRPPLGRE